MADPRPLHRIAKLLARAGVASRREIERMIEEGRVARDGAVVDTPATLLASLHGVTVDGNPVAEPAPARLFLFHKPVGVLTTERDPHGRPTIYDRLPKDLPRLVPVGRLDLNTEGLLLLTTDGGLKRQLELPATGVQRAYRARAYGAVSQAQLEELIDGIEIDGVRYGSIDANLERRTGANTWVELILTEGKNREVRRVLEHLGLQVNRLIRTRYGPFVLGDLHVGGVGEVRVADLVAFRQSLKAGRTIDPVAVASAGAPPRRQRPATPSKQGAAAGRAPATARSDGARRRSGQTPDAAPTSRTGARPGPRAKPGAASERPPRQKAATGRPTSKPGIASEQQAAADTAPARPARPPARKKGWAKPKPRTGPGRPKAPRR